MSVIHSRLASFVLLAMMGGLLSGCATPRINPPPSYASYFDRSPCADRIGRCFDATIGGQPVSVIASQERHQLISADANRANRAVREIYWEVLQPINGNKVFDVEVKANALGQTEIGDPIEEPTLTIYPLDGQILQNESELVANQNVRVQGQPVVTQQNTLKQNFLPAGRYVIALKYVGQKNWERKQILLKVK